MATSGEAGVIPVSSNYPDGGLAEFVDILMAIDTTSLAAKENATSIADNNGGRILL